MSERNVLSTDNVQLNIDLVCGAEADRLSMFDDRLELAFSGEHA